MDSLQVLKKGISASGSFYCFKYWLFQVNGLGSGFHKRPLNKERGGFQISKFIDLGRLKSWANLIWFIAFTYRKVFD